jgi:hypothetical protein
MRTLKRIALGLLVLGVLVAAFTGVAARVRERKVVQVKSGMHKSEVEQLLGPGRPDIMSPACEKCPTGRSQYVYRANQSLWYGRLEDALVVCYTNDVVCDTTRVGL